jgi:glycyl-tRNA synthetase
VGCADRSCFDLTQHTKHSGVKLAAEKRLPEPRIIDVTEIQTDKGIIGKNFKANAKQILQHFEGLSEEEVTGVEKLISTTEG